MNFVSSKQLISDQIVPTPIRDRLLDITERIGFKLEDMTDDMVGDDPFKAFKKVLTTISQVGTMWLGSSDSDVKELMESLADADIQIELKKEIVAAHAKGQQIIP